ncbi:hypothetical protein, conserved [Babesia bigemina]|uniref:Uncharacterized protein n=1 Tax=Babesia bigemina TaxID=5866 RepID=A0A061D6M5_BABBI|nr:hypothetical protein, conserved [Babesia bigemina]CDR95672.1 hypothetical protein, conserved [Babesia bigemina]|eukprot:XP_012767858.1 hypothetical protein, conserved [Babesia bigemina]
MNIHMRTQNVSPLSPVCATRSAIGHIASDVSRGRAEQHVDTGIIEKSKRTYAGYPSRQDDTCAEGGEKCSLFNGRIRRIKIDSLLKRPDELNLAIIHRTITDILDCGMTLESAQVDVITQMMLKCCDEDHVLALQTVCLVLLACAESLTESAVKKIGDIMGTATTATSATEQLALVDLYHCISSHHSYVMRQLSCGQRSYMQFLNEVRQYIRLKVPCDTDSKEIEDLRHTLNALNVEHYAAIAGHVYLPIVLSGTHMVIELSTESDLKCLNMEGAHPIKL